MAIIDEVPKYLEELSQLVPGFPTLSVSNPWHIPQSWAKESFPNASSPGVYLFSDAAGNVIYVGKASFGLGSRIGSEYIGRNGICKSDKVAGAVTLHTIPVEQSLFFLASAVEEFLISRLQPSNNVHGVRVPALPPPSNTSFKADVDGREQQEGIKHATYSIWLPEAPH